MAASYQVAVDGRDMELSLLMSAPARADDPHVLERDLVETFGVRYFAPVAGRPVPTIADAQPANLYHYRCYLGPQTITVERGDCVYFIGEDGESAHLRRGPTTVTSAFLATVMRGYMPETKSTTMVQGTTLPYVNGCSTKQLFPPDRPGDPTLQLLYMPPNTTEQAHHVHSTARVVYVLRGRGTSVVGIGAHIHRHPLLPGMVCILEPMCPHHFETGADPLVCVPLHVFSSTGAREFEHPMFQGTHVVDR